MKKHERIVPFRHRKFPADHLRRIYNFLKSYQKKNGFMPNSVEVARHFKTHHSSVALWYKVMEENGMLKRKFNTTRAIQLLPLQETQPQEVNLEHV